MGKFKDYYFVLGVSRRATREDIDNAYRYSLNMINSSDLGSFAENGQYQASMLRDINEAYECLRNPILRSQYDNEIDVAMPTSPSPEKVNPALRTANTRETLEMCFAAMKKKKSRSLPSLGRFLSAILFLASVGYSASLGLNYFNTGKFSFGAVKSQPSQTITAFSAQTQLPAGGAGQTARPQQTTEAVPAKTPKSGGQGYVKVYNIRYGGVITTANAACRKDPSPNSPILARMPKNAAIFVTKESRNKDGTVWYLVDSSDWKGWVQAEALKVYK
jgi:curved DNA-binding protein CbpA